MKVKLRTVILIGLITFMFILPTLSVINEMCYFESNMALMEVPREECEEDLPGVV